jgi:hypothetical protein
VSTRLAGRLSLRSLAVCSMAVLAMAVAGCSSKATTTSAAASSSTTSASTDTSYPADKAQLCAARDQLKASVTALATPSLLVGGTTAIKSAIDKVQTDADAVKAAAKQDYQPQVNALQTSVQDLRTAAGNLGSGSVTKNLQTVGSDIAKVGTAAEALFTQLTTSCGS